MFFPATNRTASVTAFPLLQKDLLAIQQLLNYSETSLHQLTAMLDCRGLHKVSSGVRRAAQCALGAWAARAFWRHEGRDTPLLFSLPLQLKDYLDALIGICYDGVEGLLYLLLFSLLAAVSFSTIICAVPRAWKQLASR